MESRQSTGLDHSSSRQPSIRAFHQLQTKIEQTSGAKSLNQLAHVEMVETSNLQQIPQIRTRLASKSNLNSHTKELSPPKHIPVKSQPELGSSGLQEPSQPYQRAQNIFSRIEDLANRNRSQYLAAIDKIDNNAAAKRERWGNYGLFRQKSHNSVLPRFDTESNPPPPPQNPRNILLHNESAQKHPGLELHDRGNASQVQLKLPGRSASNAKVKGSIREESVEESRFEMQRKKEFLFHYPPKYSPKSRATKPLTTKDNVENQQRQPYRDDANPHKLRVTSVRSAAMPNVHKPSGGEIPGILLKVSPRGEGKETLQRVQSLPREGGTKFAISGRSGARILGSRLEDDLEKVDALVTRNTAAMNELISVRKKLLSMRLEVSTLPPFVHANSSRRLQY